MVYLFTVRVFFFWWAANYIHARNNGLVGVFGDQPVDGHLGGCRLSYYPHRGAGRGDN